MENVVSTNVTYKDREECALWNADAVKEAVINFIVHNDYTREVTPLFEIYSDRLEITLYGGLVEWLSMEEIFLGVLMPRNLELMRILKDIELVEYIGSGMGKILKIYNKNNFIFKEYFLRFSIPFEKVFLDQNKESSEKSLEIKLTKRELEVLEYIVKNPNIFALAISYKLGISAIAVGKHISKLKKVNKIKRIGSAKGGYWEVL